MDLFHHDSQTPLAEQLRPKSLNDICGQDHILGQGSALQQMLSDKKMSSFLLWGPPGVGKTTLARLIAEQSNLLFTQLSAVLSGVSDLRKIFAEAEKAKQSNIGTMLFIDEIHRFNRAQQDSLLPHVEDGTVILVGATTENPSFEVNGALLSRLNLFVLNRLDETALDKILIRAEQYCGQDLPFSDDDVRQSFLTMADGDARWLLNNADILLRADLGVGVLDLAKLQNLLQQRAPLYDKAQDGHYNLMSALHKSLRGSDCDASLYWAARMLVAGEDPLYLLRRLTRFAYEDIGMADPNAPLQAINAWETYKRLGSPEGEIAIAHIVIYLATAPKSNAVYLAEKQVKQAAKKSGSLMPPKHILNAPTQMMKDLDYGKDYQYDHNNAQGFSGQNYFPDNMARTHYYVPVARGFEREIQKRLDYFEKLRKKDS